MPKVKKQEKLDESLKELNIDRELIVKEIKKELIEDLDDEVTKRVEYETKNKLEKMEKRIYKYKSTSIIRRDVIILIFLAVIVLETKVLYDNNLLAVKSNKKQNEVNNELKVDNKNEEKEEKNTEWYIKNYSYLLDNIKTSISGEDKYYLYKDNYSENNISNTVRLNMSYQLLSKDDINIENSVINVKENDLKDAYKKIFGSLDNYKAENFSNSCIQFIYNKDSKNYMAIDTTCVSSNEELIEQIKNIYEEDNKIIIETIVGIKIQENNSLINVDGNVITDNYSGNINEYEESLNKYKYIFELNDKNYYFKEINRI